VRAALAGLLALVAACTSAGPSAEPPRTGTTSAAASASPGPGSASVDPEADDATDPATPSARPTPRPRPASIPALFDKAYDGRGLRLGPVLARTDAYTAYTVTYLSGDLRISGVLDVPRGRGPFPALVLAHGYIDPAVYVNGQGLRREQDWLARAGFVVLHTDYRNHAGSDRDPSADRQMRLGYTTDVVNAVLALRRTGAVPVEDERIGLLGRSMGGGVIYNVLAAQPGLVDAAVVFAPVSSRAIDNFDRWIRDDPGRSGLSDFILRRHGEPRDNPRFWREVSPRTYFDRITEPVQIHHGTADATCPPRWSRATARAMRAAGVDVRLRTYPGEDHAFIAQWPLSMRRSVAFLRRHL
jgi:dipeptidyl aminopeptidase/acylaminoacyl peptidase